MLCFKLSPLQGRTGPQPPAPQCRRLGARFQHRESVTPQQPDELVIRAIIWPDSEQATAIPGTVRVSRGHRRAHADSSSWARPRPRPAPERLPSQPGPRAGKPEAARRPGQRAGAGAGRDWPGRPFRKMQLKKLCRGLLGYLPRADVATGFGYNLVPCNGTYVELLFSVDRVPDRGLDRDNKFNLYIRLLRVSKTRFQRIFKKSGGAREF